MTENDGPQAATRYAEDYLPPDERTARTDAAGPRHRHHRGPNVHGHRR